MSLPNALEGLARQLVERGLPIDYVEQTVAELTDHYHDLKAELCASGRDDDAASVESLHRLGDPGDLVNKTVREYQRRHWCGRWPLLTFVIAPIPALCLLWSASAAVLAGVGALCEWLGVAVTQVDGKTSLFERCLVEAIWGYTFLLVPILIAILFARLARRGGLAPTWGVVVGLQLAFFLGLTQFNVDYQRCTLQLGWPMDMPTLSSWFGWYFRGTWRHLMQVALPLALGLLIFAGQTADRRRCISSIAC